MGMSRGRKPKPTALKRLAGNPGKRKLNDAEPQPTRGKRTPPAPKHLSDEARREWRRMAPHLHRLGLLTKVDMPALEGYCAAYARWVEAERKIDETGGEIIETKNGNMIQNPWLAVANRAMKEMQDWLREFGMTPSSRSKVRVDKQDGEDEFTKFLMRRQRRKTTHG